ncbi:hypothetical protein P9E98_18075, partial [Bacillus subtilis]
MPFSFLAFPAKPKRPFVEVFGNSAAPNAFAGKSTKYKLKTVKHKKIVSLEYASFQFLFRFGDYFYSYW